MKGLFPGDEVAFTSRRLPGATLYARALSMREQGQAADAGRRYLKALAAVTQPGEDQTPAEAAAAYAEVAAEFLRERVSRWEGVKSDEGEVLDLSIDPHAHEVVLDVLDGDGLIEVVQAASEALHAGVECLGKSAGP